jgi:hypothetical protein
MDRGQNWQNLYPDQFPPTGRVSELSEMATRPNGDQALMGFFAKKIPLATDVHKGYFLAK